VKAAEFDLTERERIRQALLAYMKEHKIGTPTLALRIRQSHPREMEIPLKTLQRFLAGIRTHDMALVICKAFVEKLPNKPMPWQALGEAAFAVYGYPVPDDLPTPFYVQFSYDTHSTTFTIEASGRPHFALVEEKQQNPYEIYDGAMISTHPHAYIAVMKNRLTRTSRIHRIHHDPPTIYFHRETLT
jgi:hypothetical protein